LKDIEEDFEEFENYILEALKPSQGEVSNWDEVSRTEIETKKERSRSKKKIKITRV
jgi:hypothetical protein